MSATANRTDTTYTFGVITPEELDRLSEATSQGSFQQWSGQVRLAKIRGHEAECVGVCDASGNLVTGCVILYLNGRFGADGSVYFGPIGISDDPALLRAITEAIRESARRHHAVSVACWPNVAYRLYFLERAARRRAERCTTGRIRRCRLDAWRIPYRL